MDPVWIDHPKIPDCFFQQNKNVQFRISAKGWTIVMFVERYGGIPRHMIRSRLKVIAWGQSKGHR